MEGFTGLIITILFMILGTIPGIIHPVGVLALAVVGAGDTLIIHTTRTMGMGDILIAHIGMDTTMGIMMVITAEATMGEVIITMVIQAEGITAGYRTVLI
jgi:hypothetical protein